MKLHFFHLMPYRFLPDDFTERYRSVWVDIPKSLYDPAAGHGLYHEYLDQLLLADRLGFDGVCVNEHHQSGYGTMPSPNLMASILARETTGASVMVLGNSIALYNPPHRVAEEMAMLDVLSGGRLIAGFPVGTPQDGCVSYGVPPATLRERYAEAHQLIIRAWTEQEPFAFNGKYTKLRYVNIWPRPVQQPRPPVWIPSGSSVETQDFALRNDYVLCYLNLLGMQRATKNIEGYWNQADELGMDRNPYRLGFIQTVLVADTDAEAEKLYWPHVDYFYNKCLHIWPPFADIPGFRSPASVKARLTTFKGSAHGLPSSWGDLRDSGAIIAGSPHTVREQLRAEAQRLGIGHMMLLLQIGSMPAELVEHNTRLFADRVAGHVRDLFEDQQDHWSPRPLERRRGIAGAPVAMS